MTTITATPFDAMAQGYADQWSESEDGREQRQQVWKQVDALFPSASRLLDLGCGIGDDALHFMERGCDVMGIDSSERMIEIARSRGVEARHLDIQSLGDLRAAHFDSAISNFGALNCVADLSHVVDDLVRLIQPGGMFAICVLGRFSWRESLRFVLKGDLVRATRRWRGEAPWRGLTIYYRGRREMQRAFAPHFQLLRRVSIGGGDHQLYIFRRRAL